MKNEPVAEKTRRFKSKKEEAKSSRLYCQSRLIQWKTTPPSQIPIMPRIPEKTDGAGSGNFSAENRNPTISPVTKDKIMTRASKQSISFPVCFI